MKKTSATIQFIGLIAICALLSSCAALVVGGVAAGAKGAHDRRGFSNFVYDARIELAAYDSLNKDKELAKKNAVSFISYNGTVLMIGEVGTPELRERAQSHANNIVGVVRVVNELAIAPPATVGQSTYDKFLTARVKTALLDMVSVKGFDPTRVNVSTRRTVVYLMGLVTREEAGAVVEIARNVPNVERVVKVFEYID